MLSLPLTADVNGFTLPLFFDSKQKKDQAEKLGAFYSIMEIDSSLRQTLKGMSALIKELQGAKSDFPDGFQVWQRHFIHFK